MEEGRGEQRQKIEIFQEAQDWIEHAARLISNILSNRVGEAGAATVALAGGRAPQPVYERLSRPFDQNTIPWAAVHFFWGDERCVPGDDPQSNYGMARAAFLNRVPLPAENVHPVPVAANNCPSAADRYEQELRRFFKPQSGKPSGERAASGAGSFPIFDLILLGLGKDGHTASLFPESPALEEQHRWAVHVPESPQPPFVPRVTLTLPVINRARAVLFLVSGEGKKEIVEKIMAEKQNPSSPYPAARVQPAGDLSWLVNTAVTTKK